MSNILPVEKLRKVVERFKKENKKIVFTNGCFDIIHAGHIKLFEEAKQLGDILIVAINSDSSIRRIKGELRPLIAEKDRAKILSAIRYIDYVTIFNEDTPYKIIKALNPDVLVKGNDYKLNEVVGRNLVKRVVLVPILKGRSTTKIIKKIHEKRDIQGH